MGIQVSLVAVSRFEHIADVSITADNTQYNLPTNGGILPSDRFMEGLGLQYEGRWANPATGGPTGTLADSPYSIIERIHIEGLHVVRKQNEPFFDVRGADLLVLNSIYELHSPYTSLTSATLSTTASANNDVRFNLRVSFPPERFPINTRIGYLLDAPNYSNLKLTLYLADMKSVFSGQTTQPTESAYGGSTGNPRVRVSGWFAQAGKNYFSGFVPARCWRFFQENTSGDIVGSVTGSRQFNLNKGYKVRSYLVKTGHKGTGVSSGNNAYDTLSDTIYTNLKVFQGTNKLIRWYADMYQNKEEVANFYITRPATGYGLIDFAPHGAVFEALDTSGLTVGPTGQVDLYIAADTTGAAGDGSLLVTEELRGESMQA